MDKPTKDFLDTAQNGENFVNRIQFGISTRSKISQTPIITQQAKNQEKKKIIAKNQQYIPPQQFLMSTPQLVQYERFKALYQEITKQEKKKNAPAMFNLDILFNIYKYANVQGGLLHVSSIGIFPSVVKSVLLNVQAQSDQMQPELTSQLIQRIRQILYSIQFINANPTEKKKVYELGQVNFVGKEELKEYITDKVKGLQYFNYDLTLFQEGAQSINIDKFIFNLDYMCQHYKKENIDIRIQNPMDYGFQVSKLANKKYSMPLGDYRFYQLNCKNVEGMKNFKHLDQLGKGQIFFGVNFDPSDQMLNKQIKKNVENTFLDFHGDFDMLSYLDHDVPGCSSPQMYFKTSGCWTGGHQQNINMSALNINHGPDSSQWYTLDLKYVEQLRQELQKIHNVDLYLSEGLWYQKIDWFLSHGYPVKRFLQRKDDIVVTGPGTLHWVRSFGTALQTSWNIMPKTYQQISVAFERHKVNKEIKFRKSDTIPLKSLILKYLNHQRTIMSQQIRKLCVKQLDEWYQSEVDIVQQFGSKVKLRSYFYLKDLESFCSLCRQEVLVYFLPAPAQLQEGISCLECFKKEYKKNIMIEELFYKHDGFWMDTLIFLCKDDLRNLAQPNEIQQLCKGKHVGQIKGECKASKEERIELPQYINDQIKMNFIREIYYQNQELTQLHSDLDEIFKRNNAEDMELTATLIKERERLKPKTSKAEKMATMMIEEVEEGEVPESKIQSAKTFEEKQIQTQETRLKEEGQIGSQKSSKKEKKKKKHKSKSKKQKKRDDSPKFSTDSQQSKNKRNGSRQSQTNMKKQDSQDGRTTFYNERQSGSQSYNDSDGLQGRKNYGYRNNDTGDRQFRDQDRNRDNYNENLDNQGRDNYNNRNNYWGNNNNRDSNNGGGRNNWRDNNRDGNDRFDQSNRNNRYQDGGNRDRGGFDRNNNQGNDDQGFRPRRNFNNFDDRGDRNDRGGFDDRGRGRGRGDRGGRGGRGRGGGFNRDNNFHSDRNEGDNNQTNNDGGFRNNNQNRNQDFGNTGSKIQAPDQY